MWNLKLYFDIWADSTIWNIVPAIITGIIYLFIWELLNAFNKFHQNLNLVLGFDCPTHIWELLCWKIVVGKCHWKFGNLHPTHPYFGEISPKNIFFTPSPTRLNSGIKLWTGPNSKCAQSFCFAAPLSKILQPTRGPCLGSSLQKLASSPRNF